MLLSLKLISEMYLPRESVIASLYEAVLLSVLIQCSEGLPVISHASFYMAWQEASSEELPRLMCLFLYVNDAR